MHPHVKNLILPEESSSRAEVKARERTVVNGSEWC